LPRIMYVADDLILNANLDPTFGWWQGIHVGCIVNALEIATIPVLKPRDHRGKSLETASTNDDSSV
jgi:hypothetical protein